MSRIMIMPNYLYNEAVNDAAELEDWLEEQGYETGRVPNPEFETQVDMSDASLLICMGGDGTILRAAQLVAGTGIPLLGLSYGHLGFLTCETSKSIYGTVSAALAGELHQSRRSLLHAGITGIDETGTLQYRTITAFNEVVLARGASGKMVEFEVSANGVHIDRLRGDGFVVATATGSTGYALSAGGPIMTPSYRGLICVPVAPHTITARAFITSPSDVVELKVISDRSSDPCVFADGETFAADLLPQKIKIEVSDKDIILLSASSDSFYASVSRVFYGNVR
ncbi:MAG: NAD(+)/NADH kinase [Coriobacteriales bacterium]|nr:NAD(+)/NADH kinase [Coriobacteriales bacterium]